MLQRRSHCAYLWGFSDEVELKVFGTLTAMGIQIAKDIEIDVTYVPDGAKVRSDGKGDLLVLRSNFSVTRKELGIQLGLGSTKVANKIELDVAIVGYEKLQEEPAASGQ